MPEEQNGVTQQVCKALKVYKETGSIAKTIKILGCQKRERGFFPKSNDRNP